MGGITTYTSYPYMDFAKARTSMIVPVFSISHSIAQNVIEPLTHSAMQTLFFASSTTTMSNDIIAFIDDFIATCINLIIVSYTYNRHGPDMKYLVYEMLDN